MNDEKLIAESLSANDMEIAEHLPYLLQDLWELGSVPEVMIYLLEKNLRDKIGDFELLDLGCGKGAALIKLSQTFGCRGTGIDLCEPFITAANNYAVDYKVKDKIVFHTCDIRDAVENYKNFDLVIYGADTEVIGNDIDSLFHVKNCIKERGYFIIETALVSVENFEKRVSEIGFTIIDKVILDRDSIKEMNDKNNLMIGGRAVELIKEYPDLEKVFIGYLEDQKEECFELENNLHCVTYLIRNG